jgi:hypothetical protein
MSYDMTYYFNDFYSRVFSVPVIIISIILAVLLVVAWWKVFEKAGVPGWHAIIPFLNTYDEFKITFGNGWMFLLLLIPIVNLIIDIILQVKMSNAFHKGTGFAIGLIFLPYIFYLILGFDSSTYAGPQK